MVLSLLKHDTRSLPSRIELRRRNRGSKGIALSFRLSAIGRDQAGVLTADS